MQKSTIQFKGVDYPVRTLDIRSIPTWEDDCYQNVTVADTNLNIALGECQKWTEADAIDEIIFFYFTPGQLASYTDEELVAVLEECL